MSKNTYLKTVGLIFLIIAALHVLRLLLGWEGVIGGWELPTWISWAAIVVAGWLSGPGFILP